MLKTVFMVGASVGIGAWAGGKAHGMITSKLPASVPAGVQAALKGEPGRLGTQAATGLVAYGILRSVF